MLHQIIVKGWRATKPTHGLRMAFKDKTTTPVHKPWDDSNDTKFFL